MCGIAGFSSLSLFKNDRAGEVISNMIRELANRGPDSKGFWLSTENKLAFGHTRLSILDLSDAGAQPMISPCGNFSITYNGEIYNHMSLRKKLTRDFGVVWKGNSDTETLLWSLIHWGFEKTLKTIEGMYSFAFWNGRERTVILARDRAGEKPLYWSRQGGRLAFASELKSLSKNPDLKLAVNRNAVRDLMAYGYIPSPGSIYNEVYKLQPSHYLKASLSEDALLENIEICRYWSAADGNIDLNQNIDLALDTALSNSVSSQMLSDVPVGAFLSGGVDSSLIAALMQKNSVQPVRTFTVGFNDELHNEAAFADDVAKHLGTSHSTIYIDEADALSIVPQLSRVYCEPFADSSQIPALILSEFAKRHVSVALSGDGGDELFGGYNYYSFAPRLWLFLKKMPLRLRAPLSVFLSKFLKSGRAAKLLAVMPASSFDMFFSLLVRHWYGANCLVIGSDIFHYTDRDDYDDEEDYTRYMMFKDFECYLPDDILTKVDRAAMFHSLETRVPLLDRNVIELANQICRRSSQDKFLGKAELKRVLYKYVPPELIDRPKKGFSVPLAKWLRSDLHDWADDLLDPVRMRAEGFLNPNPISKAWQEHRRGYIDNSRALWNVIIFQSWLRENH